MGSRIGKMRSYLALVGDELGSCGEVAGSPFEQLEMDFVKELDAERGVGKTEESGKVVGR